MVNAVEEYARQVLSGHIPAGNLIKKACERHLADLQNAHERGYYFDEGSADHAIDFFSFLKHSKGEWAGQPIKLELWQKFIVGSLFGWKREDGTRRFRIGYIEVPRKNGKSTLIAGIGLYLFVADGEAGAEVYSAATKRDQAKIVFEEAKRMVQKAPALRKRITSLKINLSMESTASKFEPLGADADSLDGLNVHGAIIDELHAHKSRAMWDVMETATGARRQPLQLAITTAGFEQQSICYEQHDYVEKIMNGVVDDDTYFGYIASIDEGDDWSDPEVWAKANPNFGVSVKPDDLLRKVTKAKAMPSAMNNFLCKHLDVWTAQSERFINPDDWKKCSGKIPNMDHKPVYLGLDLSSKSDLTAAAITLPLEDGYIGVKSHFFIPEDKLHDRKQNERTPWAAWEQEGWLTATPGNIIDYEFIKQWIRDSAHEYKIEEIAYDPWNASQISVDLQEEGFTMVEVRQGYASLSEPTKELEAMVLGKKIIHDNNPVMTWCADNLVVTYDPAGNVKPDKSKASQKIDGMVALIMSISRAIVHQDTTSVYEGRGIRTL